MKSNSVLLNIINSFLKLASGGLVTAIIGFVFSSFMTKYYGAENFGKFILLQSYVIIFATIFSIQSWQPLIRSLSKLDNTEEQRTLFNNYYVIEQLFGVVGFFLALLFKELFFNIFGSTAVFFEWYSFLPIIFLQTSTTLGWLRYKHYFGIINSYLIIQSGMLLLISLFVYYFTNNIESIDIFSKLFPLAYLVSYIVVHFKPIMSFGLSLKIPSKKVFKDTLISCYAFYFVSLSDIPVRDLVSFIINKFCGENIVAFYKVLSQFGALMSKISIPVYQAAFSDINKLFKENEISEALSVCKKLSLILFIFSLILWLTLSSSYSYWISTIFSLEYISLSYYFYTYMAIQVFIVTTVLIHPFFICTGQDKELVKVTFFVNLIFLIFVYVLGNNFEFFGILTSLFIQVFLLFILKLFYIKRYLNENITDS